MSNPKNIDQKLAIHGGKPVRTKPLPAWPSYDEEIEAAITVLRSGKHARQSGSYVAQFEAAFAAYFGVKHAIAVSSGTAAIHVALAALGIGPGDDVINTAHCFIGTATPVVHCGAVPIFADIDPKTFNLDPKSVREKITPFTKAIVPVHLNGCPAEMNQLLEIAKQYNLYIVEDAAQAHGARYRDKLVGTFGQFGCFSFWEDKIISTAGEGGMIITDDDQLAKRARMIQHHGELRQDGDYYRGERLYYHPILGYNFRMTEVQGAIGLVQLRKLPDYIVKRRKNAHLLTQLLSDIWGVFPPYEPDYVEHVYYKYILKLDRKVLKTPAAEIAKAISAEGIPATRRYPTPLHQQPIFVEKRGFGNTNAPFSWYPGEVQYGSGLPVAETIPNDLIMIRMNPNLTEEDIADIAYAVRKVVEYFSQHQENS
jgi:perosamine synthetase